MSDDRILSILKEAKNEAYKQGKRDAMSSLTELLRKVEIDLSENWGEEPDQVSTIESDRPRQKFKEGTCKDLLLAVLAKHGGKNGMSPKEIQEKMREEWDYAVTTINAALFNLMKAGKIGRKRHRYFVIELKLQQIAS